MPAVLVERVKVGGVGREGEVEEQDGRMKESQKNRLLAF